MGALKRRVVGGLLCGLGVVGCGGIDGQSADLTEAPEGYYSCGEGVGYLPDNRPDLSDEEREGRCTWELNTFGTERLYRALTIDTEGAFEIIQLMDTSVVSRRERFDKYGVINDPGCKPSDEPNEYGLKVDECVDPNSTGIVGLRKFGNPKFDPGKWSLAAYRKTPAKVEPPYLIGINCGSCHVAFNPENPPKDVYAPKWENLHSSIGNQYFHEGNVFSVAVKEEDDFRLQVLQTQQRGTSDTSRVASDHINNPNAINAIFNLGQRVAHSERMADGSEQMVPRVLKDGADSIGIAGAALRVFVNTGMCSEIWLSRHDALVGKEKQQVLHIDQLRAECAEYREAETRMPNMAAFLATHEPPRLENAPGGKSYLSDNADKLARGKVVFAENCATCHSSEQPPAELTAGKSGDELQRAIAAYFKEAVLRPDFFEKNFLSDDKRYAVTELGTNAARSLATNAKEGHIWHEFSAQSYKDLPSPGSITVHNPVTGENDIEFEIPDGGNGYYRTPSLTGIWTSAPFLHNNMLGTYTGNPSVEGRMQAFDDAVTKLLWPEQREGTIKRTQRDSELKLPWMPDIHVPEGTPVNLLASLDPRSGWVKTKMLGLSLGGVIGIDVYDKAESLLALSQSPDLIEDKGHYFGNCGSWPCGSLPVPAVDLSEKDKLALIELLKRL